jgi:hypothetical protein
MTATSLDAFMEVFSSFFSSAANTAELNSRARMIGNFSFMMMRGMNQQTCHVALSK